MSIRGAAIGEIHIDSSTSVVVHSLDGGLKLIDPFMAQ